MTESHQDISLVIAGEAGQGIQTIGSLLMDVLHHSNYHVFSTKEYMSRVRGGSNSIEIRISATPVSAFINRIDLLVLLDEKAFSHLSHRITDETVVIGDKAEVKTLSHPHLYAVDFLNEAKEIGSKVYANTIAVGFLSSLLHIPFPTIKKRLRTYFKDKSKKIIEENIQAVHKGQDLAQIITDIQINTDEITSNSDKNIHDQILLNGTQAIGLGALAGNCQFISSYPMSPSTGVLSFLAQHGPKANVLVEQAESEIAAINMALGAWYAGSRAMVTTSGGGFALMGEGLSLAAMTETPLVIHLAQRPGPATGLPTRTEQADLNLALYSGHGEFPRIIYAPGTLEQGFLLTKKAFDFADKYQIPVIILSDQYYVDSFYQIPSLSAFQQTDPSYIIKTDSSYQRYADSKNGVSPRGIPGNGSGFVCVDSDEHDADGRITESATVRKQMMEKRLRKIQELRTHSIPPTLYGSQEYNTLLIGWGSTVHLIEEARKYLSKKHVSFLHFPQVYPLNEKTKMYLRRAKHIISIEQNATAQFAHLVTTETGHEIDAHILHYTGHPFSVESLINHITQTIRSLEES